MDPIFKTTPEIICLITSFMRYSELIIFKNIFYSDKRSHIYGLIGTLNASIASRALKIEELQSQKTQFENTLQQRMFNIIGTSSRIVFARSPSIRSIQEDGEFTIRNRYDFIIFIFIKKITIIYYYFLSNIFFQMFIKIFNIY